MNSSAPASFFSRFKIIILGIIALFLLNLSVIFILYYTNLEGETNRSLINIAGRQRKLSQEITKNIAFIKLGIQTEQSKADLKKTTDLFNKTLEGFNEGRTLEDTSGKRITISATQDPKAREILKSILDLWNPIHESLTKSFHNNQDIQSLLNTMVIENKKIETLANDFTDAIEYNAKKQKQLFDIIQTVILIILLSIFLLILYYFFNNIRKSDLQITEQNKELELSLTEQRNIKTALERNLIESQVILNTVPQGLLLIDSKYQISAQHSNELAAMFRQEVFHGFSFLNILKRVLTDNDFQISRDFLELLFNPTKKEKTLTKINPLIEAEIHFQENNASFSTKYYQFQFKRVFNKDIIENVFISISDITNQVLLERQLKESNEEKEKQFSILRDIIQVNPNQLNDFLQKVDTEVTEINAMLKAEDFIGVTMGNIQTGVLRKLLQTIFTKTHALKGYSSALGIEIFTTTIHQFEEVVYRTKNRPKLSGEDFLGITKSLADIKNTLTSARDLFDKLGKHQNPEKIALSAVNSAETSNAQANASTFGLSKDYLERMYLLEQLVLELNAKTNKKAKLIFKINKQYSANPIPIDSVFDIIAQFIRNSFAHGIETEAERTMLNKNNIAEITIFFGIDEEGRRNIIYKDDGGGINPENLSNMLIQNQVFTPEQLKEMSEPEILNTIFKSGLSTSDAVDEIAGRGVGLDVVKQRVFDLNGSIYMHNTQGQSLQFNLIFP
jgi:hypothetical protein